MSLSAIAKETGLNLRTVREYLASEGQPRRRAGCRTASSARG